MEHYGIIAASSTLYIPFTTHDTDGAAVAPNSAFEAADVRIYKDGSATQRNTEAGYTMTSPFDSVTGLHLLAVDLSDNTDAGFYAAGSRYFVALVPDETVDGFAVVRVLADFHIGPPAVNVSQFGGTNGTFSGGRPEVNASHAAGTAWNSGAITASTIATGAIDADAIADNAIDAGAIADGAITAAKIATDAIDADALAANAVTEIQSGLSTLTAAQVQTEAEEALQAYHLDHLIASADPGGVVANSSFLAKLTSKSATPAFSSYDNTTDSLEALRDNVGTAGAGLTAIDLPDQSMNITGNITGNLSGSVGSVTGAVGSVTGNVGGNVTGSVGSVATGGISASSFTSGAIDAAAIAPDAIGSSELAASAVTEIQSGLSTHSAADVWAVATRTLTAATNITSTGGTTVPQTGDSYAIVNSGTHGNAALKTLIDTIDDFLDTEIAAIKTVTDQFTAAQSEPSAAPAANATPLQKIAWLALLARNKVTQTATTQTAFADNGSTTVATSSVSDDGTTFTRAEWS